MGEHGGDVLIWVVPFPFEDDDVGTNLAGTPWVCSQQARTLHVSW